MTGNITIKNVLHGVNVTFTCPFSMYHAVRNVFIVETKNSWRFSKFFYISVIALVVCALIGIVVLILYVSSREKMDDFSPFSEFYVREGIGS